MEIKRIEHLSKDECMEYMHNNPNGELAKEVQGRLSAILATEEKARLRKETERKASVILKNKWIDINQFLEDRKYRNRQGLRVFLLLLFFICMIFVVTTLYYTSTTHYIYSEWRYEQANHVYGLENIMLVLQFIRPCYWYSSSTDFPIWDYYEVSDTFVAILFIGIFLLILLLITSLNHSSLIGKIYNISDGTKADKFRPIQNKQGRCGLCQLGRTRLKRLLPFQYDLICPTKENSFICCKDSKYGVYNAATKKMVIPVIYDEVYSLEESILKLVKNGETYIFSYKGYRIIE